MIYFRLVLPYSISQFNYKIGFSAHGEQKKSIMDMTRIEIEETATGMKTLIRGIQRMQFERVKKRGTQ